jgi:hypothetical protein
MVYEPQSRGVHAKERLYTVRAHGADSIAWIASEPPRVAVAGVSALLADVLLDLQRAAIARIRMQLEAD